MTLDRDAPDDPPAGDPQIDGTLLARLADVATMACHAVPGCACAAISIALPSGVVTAAATSEAARALAAVQSVTGDGPCLQALRRGTVVRVDDLSTDRRWPELARAARAAGLCSLLAVPLRSGDRLVGVLGLHGGRPGAFDQWSQDIASVLARQAADAVNDGELLRRSVADHARHQQIAQTLQRGLLPVVPELPGIVSAARYLVAEHSADVGGDWYDVFVLPDEAIGLAVGDVMGHDIAAAAAMGQLRSVLRSYAYASPSPADVLDRLDRLAQGFDMALATAVYGTLALQAGGGRLAFCNAGHVPPILRMADGRVRQLQHGASWLIGVPSSLGPRSPATAWLPSGTTLVLYTDGLVERHRHHLDEGIDRLCRALSGPLADDAPDALCDRVLDAMADDGCVDDLALLAVRVE